MASQFFFKYLNHDVDILACISLSSASAHVMVEDRLQNQSCNLSIHLLQEFLDIALLFIGLAGCGMD